MNVYSGKCEHGECGIVSDLIDSCGESLRVGDIIAISEQDSNGLTCFHAISAVVDDRPELVGRKEKGSPFVMGLYGVDFSKDFSEDDSFYIKRIKKFEDVVDGEHWKAYGFNYKEEK